MKKYLSFFRLRFLHGLQYRTAAVSGIVTQFVWGAMEILLFRAFYQADPTSFPMTFQALSTYVWLQQAFLALYMAWFWEMELFDSITTGNVAYELCRPVRLYNMWYVRSLAVRRRRCCAVCRFSSQPFSFRSPTASHCPPIREPGFLPYFPWFWRCSSSLRLTWWSICLFFIPFPLRESG